MDPIGRAAEDSEPGSQRLGQADFDRVYQENLARVYGFVVSQVGNPQDAEDLTSQVFLKVYNSLGRFEGRGSLAAWLFRIARVTVNDFWRDRYKLPALPLAEDWDGPEPRPQRFDRAGREELVHELLDRLPPKHREVLNHRFLKRYSVKETALSLGLTETNVKVLQFRALRLAAELGKDLIS